MTVNTYKTKYEKEAYFKVTLRLPKQRKEVLKQLANEQGTSINKLIVTAVEQYYNIDLSKPLKTQDSE